MVVVMIIAILVGIAIPAFLGARKRAQDTASKSNLRNGLGTAQTIFTDNQAYLATAAMVTNLGSEEPSLTFQDGATASTAAKQISLKTLTSSLGTAGVPDEIILASQSGSGNCYFLRHIATSGGALLSGSYMASTTGTCKADSAPADDAAGTLPAAAVWKAL
jgi:type II secretory pathway pseudopilin PulG